LKILHVIPSFAPAWRYGGPIFAVDEMTRELARAGHSITVMTTNIDGPGVLDVSTDRPVDRAGVEVWYFPVERPRGWCYSRALGRALRERIPEFEIVHIHSMFLWPTFAAARERMGRAAREFVLREFSFERFRAAWREVLAGFRREGKLRP